MKYLLVFVLFVGFCQAYGQQAETTEPAQNSVGENLKNIHNLPARLNEKGGEIQDKVVTRIDSLSNKSATLLENATDSLNNLSSSIQGKLQSSIDSLQQKLEQITNNGNEKLSNATEKADKLTRRIDSLQNVLSNKLQLDKLGKYGVSVTGADFADKLKLPELNSKSIPELEKLSLPEMKGLSGMNTQILKQVQDDGGGGIGALASQADEQLGKIGNLKNNDWIKCDLPDYQEPEEVKEYTELLKDPSNIDQTIDSKAAQMSEFQALNNETKELAAMKELPESMLADLKRYQDAQAMRAEAKDVAIKKATDYFANHQDKLSKAQGMMSKLKKKYSCVPDSRDLSTATKASSLKGEPLKRRLVFGLGFQVQRTNPISLDLSPNLLYRFNKMFSAGISGTYRASLGIENNSSVAMNTATDVYGASAIVQHK
ncbi:MAG: hypothetical protein KAH23_10580, partial [Kiritimatiellae bacterium]|nr:hypothetical protein [Kiritimatiellia bacterium]